MRMRKLEIKSIRAASTVRQALINLDALPQSSPVCGLIRVSEVERLARSYGIEPPQVLYDVFLLWHSNQKRLPNYSRSNTTNVVSRTSQVMHTEKHEIVPQTSSVSMSTHVHQKTQETKALLDRPVQVELPSEKCSTEAMSQYSTEAISSPSTNVDAASQSASDPSTTIITSSESSSSKMFSTVTTTSTSDKDALIVSVPRHLLTSHFRLVPRPVAPPGVMAGLHSHSYTSPPFRGSVLQSLAKRISQRSKKYGKGM